MYLLCMYGVYDFQSYDIIATNRVGCPCMFVVFFDYFLAVLFLYTKIVYKIIYTFFVSNTTLGVVFTKRSTRFLINNTCNLSYFSL